MRLTQLQLDPEGQVIGRYFKQLLPNYAVFDEQRYFTPCTSAVVDLHRVCTSTPIFTPSKSTTSDSVPGVK